MLKKILFPSIDQTPRLEYENSTTYITKLLWVWSELMHVKHLGNRLYNDTHVYIWENINWSMQI